MVDKPKDDNAFEDADFEDLDALEDDDLGDENWDDDLSGTGAADDSSGGDDDDSEPRAPREKTFVQKNFMLIVGAVVIVFGGLVGIAFMGGGSPSPLPDEQAAAPGDALPDAPATTAYEDGADMPPMPAPINPEQADGALTPMPMPGDLQDTELAELDVDEVPAQPPSGTTPQGEEPFDYRSNEQRENSDEPAPKNAAEQLNAAFKQRTETDSVAPAPADSGSLMDSEGNIIAMPAPVIPEEQPAEKPAPVEPAPTLQAPAEPSPQLEAQKTEIESLQSKLTTQESQIAESEKAAQALEDSLKSKNEEIAALSKKIEELEQKLASAERAPAAAPEKAASTPKAAKPAPAAEKPAAKKAPAATTTAKAPAAAAATAKVVSWELKAAQPGKAVLASRSTGDTRNVSVGDTVDGLGKITAISNETGRWTVRGTKGQVIR